LNGTYDVQYDDGDKDAGLTKDSIRRFKNVSGQSLQFSKIEDENKLEAGSIVEARYRGKSRYFPGKISRVCSDGTMDILYNDGEKEFGVSSEYIRTPNCEESKVALKDQGQDPRTKENEQDCNMKSPRAKKDSNCELRSPRTNPCNDASPRKHIVAKKATGKGNKRYRGVIKNIKVVYLYDVEYEDGDMDVNLPFNAIRVNLSKKDSELRKGNLVDVLSWQDRYF